MYMAPSHHSDPSLLISSSEKPYLTAKSEVDSTCSLTYYSISFSPWHFSLPDRLLFICPPNCLSRSTKQRKSMGAETLSGLPTAVFPVSPSFHGLFFSLLVHITYSKTSCQWECDSRYNFTFCCPLS